MKEQQSNAGKYDPQMRALAGTDSPLRWHEPAHPPFRLTGFPWFAQDGLYRRMPLHPQEALPKAVDALANCTAGGQIAFQSNSTHIAIKVVLDGLADMVHMPATGQCGFDLYMGQPGAMRFCASSKYDHSQSSYELLLLERKDNAMRSFVLNFPLYRGVREMRIGLDVEAAIQPPEPFSREGSIVIYGTSITQGGCACRPGMAYTNILGRKLNLDIVNLGFSGNGRGEAHVIRTVASIPNPLLFVLDYEANCCGYDQYSRTLQENIAILRKLHGDIPILLISRIAYARDIIDAVNGHERQRSLDMQKELISKLQNEGDAILYFLDGSKLLGEDFDECTVDGVHPNDLGFMRMAQNISPVIREILKL